MRVIPINEKYKATHEQKRHLESVTDAVWLKGDGSSPPVDFYRLPSRSSPEVGFFLLHPMFQVKIPAQPHP